MRRFGFALAVLFGLAVIGCRNSDSTAVDSPQDADKTSERRKFDFKPKESLVKDSETASSSAQFPLLTNVAETCGIEHVFDNGASPKALMVESTGGGCGWFDFDRDGRIDLYLSQGGVPCPAPGDVYKPDVLFRQTVDGKFVNCFQEATLEDDGFGHGIACGDFDNDGFDDVFVANAGISRLFRNLGDGTFEDATASLQDARSAWSSTAAWGDVDRDGDLDLYVCNYAIYDPCNPVPCLDKDGIPSICHPRNVQPEPDMFFRNIGDGSFQECSKSAGLFGPGNKALGVAIADFNGDDWPDLYVANDTTANFLFINSGDGATFSESALLLGGGVSATGEPQASMGVAFGDYDNNGFPDVMLSHFTGESNTLYQNRGPQGLHDVSAIVGLREPSLPKLGFGTIMSDLDGNGHMDLFVTNGHIDPRYAEAEGYEMNPQLFTFDGRLFREYKSDGADFFSGRYVGRGVATADYDQDGDLDLCVVHHNTPTAVLRNDSRTERLIQVRLIGLASNRNAVNTKVRLTCGGTTWTQELAGGTSYAASHERVLSFGLGKTQGPVKLEITWPSGTLQTADIGEGIASLLIPENRPAIVP